MENISNALVYEDADLFLFMEEMKILFPIHYDELCETKEFPLDPDYDSYMQLCNANMIKCITCRMDGELIGYATFIIKPHLHYKSWKTAFEDIYFIKKEFRKKHIGIGLLQYSEGVLKSIGVNRVIMHTKVHMDNSGLFEYLGYRITDKIFTKILDLTTEVI